MPWSATRADVLVAMGSESDYETMQHATATLEKLGVFYDCRVISAHRTPDRITQFLNDEALAMGIKIIIAGAGGAAHLPGMFAAHTPLPVLGVPVQSRALSGWDSLLSIVQMPAGVPVATFSIGQAGATNAALFAAAMLGVAGNLDCTARLREYRVKQTDGVPERPKAFLKALR